MPAPSHLRLPALAVLMALLAMLPAQAGRHALLIGVSTYRSLPKALQLRGPAHDVQALRRLLGERGYADGDVTVLADGVGSSLPPTRAAILQALGRLAGRLNSGDHLIVYFAGHGARQPQSAIATPREPDGIDEVFLPADAGYWDGGIGSIANAIVDDELGAALNRLAATGATVWAIFDTCHAGSMLRADPSASRIRGVHGGQLRVPALPQVDGRRPPGIAEMNRGDNASRLAVFWAAAADQRTAEEPAAPSGEPHGVFTHALVTLLGQQPDLSLEALLAGIRKVYARDGRLSPTPGGTASDALMRTPAIPP